VDDQVRVKLFQMMAVITQHDQKVKDPVWLEQQLKLLKGADNAVDDQKAKAEAEAAKRETARLAEQKAKAEAEKLAEEKRKAELE